LAITLDISDLGNEDHEVARNPHQPNILGSK